MRPGKRTYDGLFTPAGCLKADTMERYLAQRLNPGEKIAVEEHVADCEMCSDALEGFGQMAYRDRFREITGDINHRVNRKVAGGRGRVRQLHSRTFYFAVAATVILLIGITYILFLQTGKHTDVVSDLAEEKQAMKEVVKQEEGPTEAPVANEPEAPKETAEKKQPTSEHKAITIVENDSKTEKTTEEPSLVVEPPEESAVAFQMDEETVEAEGASGTGATGSVSVAEAPVAIGGVADVNEEEVSAKEYTSERKGLFGRQKSKSATQTANGGSRESFDNSMKEVADDDAFVYTVVEQMPEFPGGEDALIKYLSKNLNYPDSALRAGVQGKVYISFTVKKDGSITNASVLRGIGAGCDEEALRVIRNMPEWIPGRQRGREVDVLFTIPIVFKLDR